MCILRDVITLLQNIRCVPTLVHSRCTLTLLQKIVVVHSSCALTLMYICSNISACVRRWSIFV